MESQAPLWMARAFAALANENRLAKFEQLRSKELECNAGDVPCSFTDHCCSVGELLANLKVTPATVFHHLIDLSRAGVVETKRRRRIIYCFVNESATERLEWFLRSTVPASASVP